MSDRSRTAVASCACAALIIFLGGIVPAMAGDGRPDVVGITPGMSVDEALAIVKRHNPRLVVYPRPGTNLLPDVQFSEGVSARTDDQKEVIELSVAMAPSPATVWGILRSVTYPADARPTVANVIQALRQKYGKEDGTLQHPASARAAGVELLDAFWVFDDAGKRVPAAAARSYVDSCRTINSPPGRDTLALTQTNRATWMTPADARCDRWTIVHAQWQPTPPGGSTTPGLVMNMSTQVASGALHGKSYAATLALIEGAARDRQKREVQAADQVKPVL